MGEGGREGDNQLRIGRNCFRSASDLNGTYLTNS